MNKISKYDWRKHRVDSTSKKRKMINWRHYDDFGMAIDWFCLPQSQLSLDIKYGVDSEEKIIETEQRPTWHFSQKSEPFISHIVSLWFMKSTHFVYNFSAHYFDLSGFTTIPHYWKYLAGTDNSCLSFSATLSTILSRTQNHSRTMKLKTLKFIFTPDGWNQFEPFR